MRAPRFPVLTGLLLAGLVHAADPVVGATRAEVEAELGKPTATRRTDDGAEISVYPRGTAAFRAGRVTDLKIISKEEYEARVAAEKRAAEAFRERKAKLDAARAQRFAAANAARDAMLAKEDYKQLSARGRLERLNALLVAHPDAEVATLHADLLRAAEAEALAAKRESEAELFRKSAEDRVKKLTGELADTRAQLAEAGARLVAAEQKIESLGAELADFKKRFVIIEEMVKTRAVTPSDGVSQNILVNTSIGAGKSDSGVPSH